MSTNKKWKKRWKKYRGVTIRTAILFTLIIIAFLVLGRIGGFFTISDLRNDVVQTTYDNEYGGETYSKETTPDKVIVLPDSYNELLTPIIDDEKAYSFIKAWSKTYNKVMEYDLSYRTNHSYDEVVDFYMNYYPENVVLTESTGDAVMWTTYLNYKFEIVISEVDEEVDVNINAKFTAWNVN